MYSLSARARSTPAASAAAPVAIASSGATIASRAAAVAGSYETAHLDERARRVRERRDGRNGFDGARGDQVEQQHPPAFRRAHGDMVREAGFCRVHIAFQVFGVNRRQAGGQRFEHAGEPFARRQHRRELRRLRDLVVEGPRRDDEVAGVANAVRRHVRISDPDVVRFRAAGFLDEYRGRQHSLPAAHG